MRKWTALFLLSLFCFFAYAQKASLLPKQQREKIRVTKQTAADWVEKKNGAPSPGKPVTVIIQGVTHSEKKNIHNILGLGTHNQLKTHFDRRIQVRLAALSMKRLITQALEPYGYFSPQIHQNISQTTGGWKITYTINLGKPVLYQTLRLKIIGATFPKEAQQLLKKNWPIQNGNPFTLSSYNKAKNLLVTLANDYGFFSNKIVTAQAIINRFEYRADVSIIFFLGKRYRFGKTTFNKTRLSNPFLHRFLLYHENEPYQVQEFNNTRAGFIDSLYFSSVNLTLKPDKKTGEANTQATLALLPPHTYTVGAGYGTDTGPRGLVSTTLNDLNPHGDKFKLLLRGSRVNSAFITSYIIPGSYPPDDKYSLTASLTNLDEIPGTAFSRQLAAGYATKRDHWTFGAQLNLLKENYNLNNLPKTKTNLFYPNINAQYLIADNLLFPKEGFSFTTSISGASKQWLSETSFSQYRVNLRAVTTFWDRLRILLRTQIAYSAVKQVNQIPLTLQLMAGGSNSIRGLSYNSIYNGRELFVGSSEAQVRIYGNWYIAGFYDTGNVSNNIFKQKLLAGAGPAILYASPFGAIELSAAKVLSTTYKNSWKIQIFMGTFL